MNTDKIYLFDYRSYKPYLLAVSGGKTLRRGMKAKLAQAAECQSTYISHVLHGQAHLSPEQAERISRFLQHGKEEAQYFLMLLHHDRAGSTELKKFYREQIEEQIQKRMNLVNRLGAKNALTEEQHTIYYSSWQYAAVHMALTIPQLQSKAALAQHFQIGHARLDQILDFLVRTGLARQDRNQFTTGELLVRIGKESPHLFKHLSHWRQQAIESLERQLPEDLHYSAVVTLAKSDVPKLRERMLEALKENIKIIQESKEEEVYVYNIDFFSLKKSETA